MATASALRDLRELLDLKFPDAAPLQRHRTEVVATGIGELDGIFPSGGFPRGRLSVWAPGGGATAVLRSACRSAVAGGERAVWIDGGGTMAGAFWDAGPILVRPKSRLHALRAAESLLRSGGFAVVVLAGADPEGTENVRLSRAAHESGSACIAPHRQCYHIGAARVVVDSPARLCVAPRSAWRRGSDRCGDTGRAHLVTRLEPPRAHSAARAKR